jgi:thiol-disulfide isomerase/thioredoxin
LQTLSGVSAAGPAFQTHAASRARFAALLLWSALLALSLLALACGKPAPPQLEETSLGNWQGQILPAHRGKILVVPVWASWCQTCAELLPSLSTLAGEYETRGVEVVGLCVDDADDLPALGEARQLLNEQQAPFHNYLLRSEISQTLAQLDLGGLPAVLVYDAQGELRYRLEGDAFENRIEAADVTGAIESLL